MGVKHFMRQEMLNASLASNSAARTPASSSMAPGKIARSQGAMCRGAAPSTQRAGGPTKLVETNDERRNYIVVCPVGGRPDAVRSSVEHWGWAKKNLLGVKRGACPSPRLPLMGGEASSSQRPPLADGYPDSEQARGRQRARAAGPGALGLDTRVRPETAA